MEWFTKLYLRLRHDDRGASMVEYVLLAGLIAVFLTTAIGSMNTEVTDAFKAITNKLPNS